MKKMVAAELIKEGVEELRSLERSQTKAMLRDRVRFIRLCKEDGCLSLSEAAEKAGGYKKSWAYNILRLYRQKGVQALTIYPIKGKPCRLSDEQQNQLKESLGDDDVSSLKQGADLIKKTTGVEYCESAVWFVFKRIGIKKKTGRPSNVRKDEEGAAAFKKKPLLS